MRKDAPFFWDEERTIHLDEDIYLTLAYIKIWLVSWSNDKELSLGADAIADVIGWNSLKKKNQEGK